MADDNVDFGPILNAASRENQAPLPDAALANAVKEDDDLFSKGIRQPLLTGAKVLIYLGLVVFCAIVGVRVWHLLIPNCGWLTEAELDRIDKIWQSGALIAFGGIVKDVLVKSLGISKKAS
jgi:hypothetical protein